MRQTQLPDGTSVPVLGQGTWMMGDEPGRRDAEIAALREGIELGMTLLDTAEIYGNGRSEQLVAEAIDGRRDEIFLVSKVAPGNASRQGTIRACEASLRRLGTDRLDLYLLHWRGSVPLAETVAALETLKESGKILRWGVSNFDVDDMEELAAAGGAAVQTDQVLYNPSERGIEYDLLPMLTEQGVPVMAYSPIGQGGDLLEDAALTRIAERHHATPARVALAFVLRQPGVIAIPKASSVDHVRDNAAALELTLDAKDMAELNAAFPPPRGKQPLAII
ncbi:diketogulonate reductase-like aldo/keto reductase [Aurantimonas endophytica]|uniref:Diketogulonate reductase-like aldo/keto reductase n=2 Tax=Aurantimonas endophytica TaxID=1522175 RepID=A0A7W6MS81_9HYPH|nr:diketogulonate reductase-like aldo/keto reductase [Aurantimonas endophytica]MCO6406300.1 aldo/keto reductase [Aurantimonas endophytica]